MAKKAKKSKVSAEAQQKVDAVRAGRPNPVRDGGVAFRAGRLRDENPNPSDTDEFKAWNRGWDEAARTTNVAQATRKGKAKTAKGKATKGKAKTAVKAKAKPAKVKVRRK